MNTLTIQENTALQFAIAAETGWKKEFVFTSSDLGTRGEQTQAWIAPSGETSVVKLPPYTTSLDAIQAAALERFKRGTEVSELSVRLEWLLKFENHSNPLAFAFWQLTPLDWCIAFAMTAKIWRYKV